MLNPPAKPGEQKTLVMGPNILPLPDFEPLADTLEGPVIIKVGHDISTDEIMPAGAEALQYRSNIKAISRYVYSQVDSTYYDRAQATQKTGNFIVGGKNYGQGSSREHAAIAPRFLGLKAVITLGFARIHHQNLCNFGVLPLIFENPKDWDRIDQEDILSIQHAPSVIQGNKPIEVLNKTKNESYTVKHNMTPRQVDMMLAGSLINIVKNKLK